MNNLLRAELAAEIEQPYELEKLRFLPAEFSTNPIVIGVFGDRVAQFIYSKELFVVVITSKPLAENYRQYYRYLWGLSTPFRPKL